MKTAARNVARTAVALAAVGVIAILNGCGAAPDGGEASTGQTQQAVTACMEWVGYSIDTSDSFESQLAAHGCNTAGAHKDGGGLYGDGYDYKIVRCTSSKFLGIWVDAFSDRGAALWKSSDACVVPPPSGSVYITWDPASAIHQPVCPNGCSHEL